MLSAVQDDYHRIAYDYDSRWVAFSSQVHDWVLHRLSAPTSVLDLGCGTGAFLQRVHERFPDTILRGLDASNDMLEIARARLPQVDFVQGDIETAVIKDVPRVITCLNVLHHLQMPDAFLMRLSDMVHRHKVDEIYICDFAIEGPLLWMASIYWQLFLPSYHKGFSKDGLARLLNTFFEIRDDAILCPDGFWRLQIYRLTPKNS